MKAKAICATGMILLLASHLVARSLRATPRNGHEPVEAAGR
jgi:hypothetical protein